MAAGGRYGAGLANARRGERGVVLVLAVFAVVLLLVLAVGLTAAVRGEMLAANTSLQRSQSLFLAEAGISQARALLLYEDMTSDTLQDVWGPEAEAPLDAPLAIGPGFLRIRVYDACGRVDINTADVVTLTRLIGDAGLAQAIVDWRGPGQEAEYYRSLPYPYVPRQAGFQTTGELLLVKGMTPDLYFGSPTRAGLRDLVTVASASLNTTADGKKRVFLNSLNGYGVIDDWASRIVSTYGGGLTVEDLNKVARGLDLLRREGQRGYSSVSQLVDAAQFYEAEDLARVVDYFSAQPGDEVTGKVNVNTAPPEVMAALPGSSGALAEAIVQERNAQPFASLGEVARVMCAHGGVGTFQQMIDFVTTKSSCFVVDSMGYTGTGRGFRRLRALVYRHQVSRVFEVAVLHQAEEDSPLPPPENLLVQSAYSRRSDVAPS